MLKDLLKDSTDRICTPAYYFDISEFVKRALMVRDEFGSIPITYSVKANPFLLIDLPDCIDRVEVCSPGEMKICIAMGVAPDKIIYSGVNKRIEDLEEAILYKTEIISVESINQLSYVQRVACKYGIIQKVILRLTSGNQFGMRVSDALRIIRNLIDYPNVSVYGIHYYSGTQKRINQIENDLAFLSDTLDGIKKNEGFNPELVEYGPGLCVDYFGKECLKNDKENLRATASSIYKLSKKYNIGLEFGRFLASSCGIYATRVNDIKNCDDSIFAICDGGIHQLKYYGQNMAMQIPNMEALTTSKETNTYCICGSLCTTTDVLVRKVELPTLKLEDVLLFYECGAYSITEGISLFLSRDLPSVFLYTKECELIKVRDNSNTYELNLPKLL